MSTSVRESEVSVRENGGGCMGECHGGFTGE